MSVQDSCRQSALHRKPKRSRPAAAVQGGFFNTLGNQPCRLRDLQHALDFFYESQADGAECVEVLLLGHPHMRIARPSVSEFLCLATLMYLPDAIIPRWLKEAVAIAWTACELQTPEDCCRAMSGWMPEARVHRTLEALSIDRIIVYYGDDTFGVGPYSLLSASSYPRPYAQIVQAVLRMQPPPRVLNDTLLQGIVANAYRQSPDMRSVSCLADWPVHDIHDYLAIRRLGKIPLNIPLAIGFRHVQMAGKRGERAAALLACDAPTGTHAERRASLVLHLVGQHCKSVLGLRACCSAMSDKQFSTMLKWLENEKWVEREGQSLWWPRDAAKDRYWPLEFKQYVDGWLRANIGQVKQDAG